MLPVFSTQIFLSILVIAWISVRHHWVDAFATLLLLLQVVLAFVVAQFLEYWKDRKVAPQGISSVPSAA
jgi:isoprenylcysteine carboxyl methyltransferase (ICMT) family protein YpbQ